MKQQAWQDTVGEDVWNHIVGGSDPEEVGKILTRAVQAGFKQPSPPPLAITGTKAIFTDQRTGNQVAVLTAEGLRRHWARKGHGFLLLRLDQLMAAVAGPVLRWLQVILAAYEEQCEYDEVEPLPVNWRPFVGGQNEGIKAHELMDTLYEASPKPKPVERLHIAGPGAQDG